MTFFSLSVQLQLLLQYLKDDPRKAVKRLAINDLKLLAKKAPHLWIRENTQVVSNADGCTVRVTSSWFKSNDVYFCRPCVSAPWPAHTTVWSLGCWLSSPPSLEQLQSSSILVISQVCPFHNINLFKYVRISITFTCIVKKGATLSWFVFISDVLLRWLFGSPPAHWPG